MSQDPGQCSFHLITLPPFLEAYLEVQERKLGRFVNPVSFLHKGHLAFSQVILCLAPSPSFCNELKHSLKIKTNHMKTIKEISINLQARIENIQCVWLDLVEINWNLIIGRWKIPKHLKIQYIVNIWKD